MNFKRWNFIIEGTKPGLLLSNPIQIGPKKGPTKTKDIPPVEDARRGLYLDNDGFIYVPSLWFRKGLIASAGGYKIGKTSARTILAGGLSYDMDASMFYPTRNGQKLRDNLPVEKKQGNTTITPQDQYDLLTAEEKLALDWEPWATRCVINKFGVLKARPRIFTPWTIQGVIEFDADMAIKSANLDDWLEIMGRQGGIGDYAPRKGGWHGKFTITKTWVEDPKVTDIEPPKKAESDRLKKKSSG